MNEDEFKRRTKNLALRTFRMVEALPNSKTSDIISRQIIRSASSVGANYRAACRSKSTADMINKLKIVEEEADETLYWLELIIEANLLPENRLASLVSETNEIIAMTVASLKNPTKKIQS